KRTPIRESFFCGAVLTQTSPPDGPRFFHPASVSRTTPSYVLPALLPAADFPPPDCPLLPLPSFRKRHKFDRLLLPTSEGRLAPSVRRADSGVGEVRARRASIDGCGRSAPPRSEEHTSE